MKYLMALGVSGLVLWSAAAGAVVVGNPGGAIGKGEIALGLESERFEDAFEGDEVQSQRFLAKLTYGITRHIDLFAKAGTGALNVSPATVMSGSGFEGDSRVALGGGLRIESGVMHSLWNSRFFANVQWLRFESRGEFVREQTHKDWTWEERLETGYQWREIGTAFGLSRAFEKVSVYTGLAFTRISGNVDREQYVLSEDTSMKVGDGEEAFTEGPGAGLFLGVDIPLSPTFRVSTEYQMNDRSHGSFFIGICEKMD